MTRTVGRQPTLFDLEPQRTTPPKEESACISCGALEAVAQEEAATFLDKKGGVPAVSIHWHCTACGDNTLTLREQPSAWITKVWGLPPF